MLLAAPLPLSSYSFRRSGERGLLYRSPSFSLNFFLATARRPSHKRDSTHCFFVEPLPNNNVRLRMMALCRALLRGHED